MIRLIYNLRHCLTYVVLAGGSSIVSAAPAQSGGAPHTFVPKKGYVPDNQTAINIAVAIWTPIYGKEQIAREKPYHARRRGNVWIVTGSLSQKMPTTHTGVSPNRPVGGVAIAEIAQIDGRVLRISHGK
jgi:hypothetical protein